MVVGGELGLALAFFFGDEFGAFAAFGVDAVAAVLFAGLFAGGHHRAPIGVGLVERRRDRQLTGGLGQRGNMLAPSGSVVYVCPVGEVKSPLPSGSC